MSRILVTGATGFVGRALVAHLRREGHTVVAVVRKAADKPAGAHGVVVVADIVNADWTGLLGEVDAIVHLAARVHKPKTGKSDESAQFRGVNRDATLALARAGAEQGVGRFVFLSSVKAAVDRTPPEGVDETVIPHPDSFYGISKLEAEEGLIRIARETPMKVVILRPPLVYGPGVRANFSALFKLVRTRIPLPLGSVDNRRSMLGLTNLVTAIGLALTSPGVANSLFFLSDDQPVSTPDLIRAIAVASGKKARLFAVHRRMIREAAELLHQRDKVDRLMDSLVVRNDGFRKATGWTPEPMAAELARMAEALKKPAKAPISKGKPEKTKGA